jgi:hypothetical protein
MKKTIEELLNEIKEDKKDNLATTSFKFKTDLWNFFQNYHDKIAVEFGTHKGQTTRILSFLFKKVYTININDNASGKSLNSDRDNIIYIDNFDLYSSQKLPISDIVDVVLIDAGHDYEHVIADINRVFSMNCSEDCYIIFDDYGLAKFENEVKKAVDQAVSMNAITIIEKIGHQTGHDFGGIPPRILTNSEGVIAKINWQ